MVLLLLQTINCVHMHTHMHVHVQTYIKHTHTYKYTCVHNTHTCENIHKYIHVHTYIKHAHIHVHIHIKHTLIHTFSHIYKKHIHVCTHLYIWDSFQQNCPSIFPCVWITITSERLRLMTSYSQHFIVHHFCMVKYILGYCNVWYPTRFKPAKYFSVLL